MQLQELLMEACEDKHERRIELEEEVKQLRAELDGEVRLKTALQCAVQGSLLHSSPCLSSLLPHKVQALLKELAMVEEEIFWLERKVDELKLNWYKEKQRTIEWEVLRLELPKPKGNRRQQKQFLCRRRLLHHHHQTQATVCELLSISQSHEEHRRKYKFQREKRAPFGSASADPLRTLSSTRPYSQSPFYLPRAECQFTNSQVMRNRNRDKLRPCLEQEKDVELLQKWFLRKETES